VKYLKEFGWNPIVLCPEPGLYPHFDESLQHELETISADIVRIDPKTLFHTAAGSSSSAQFSVPDALAKAIRRLTRLFLYPDNKKGWIEPAVKKGIELVHSHNADLIFSTAPPFSNHLAAQKIKEATGKPMVLDYRDAWLHNHFMDGMFGWQKRIMKTLEQKCLQQADGIITLDEFSGIQLRQEYPTSKAVHKVIPHGFDPADFEGEVSPIFNYLEGKFNVLYSGLFYEQNQPDHLLHAVVKAHDNGFLDRKKVHLHFQGGLDERIKRLVRTLGLQQAVTDYGYQPHKTAVANLKQADLLWMVSNFDAGHKQVKTGKLFEYFGSQKPILGLVHEGTEAELLRKYGAGFIGSPDSKHDLSITLGELFSLWEKGNLPVATSDFVRQYNRITLTEELAGLLNEISSQ
jgi:glycosyltransferase involved in cell wall biosynthesis